MISEYLENGSLFDHLHKLGTEQLPEHWIFNILDSIINAMIYTHNKDIVHCDLKSSNILIDRNWNIWVGDFGLSKKIITKDKMSSRWVGTPYWMAPELFRGYKNTV